MKTFRRWLIHILFSLNLFLLGAGMMVLLYRVPAPPLAVPQTASDVQVTVRVHTPDDVTRVRRELSAYLFGDTPPGTASCDGDTCVVSMSNGFTSTIALRTPETPNGSLFIYHNGHLGETPDITETIDALLNAGFTVAVFDMPLAGVNPPVTVDLPLYGEVTMHQHDQMPFLDGLTDGSPIRYFIEPVLALLNAVTEGNAVEGQYEHIYMTGISGGGWTTTLAAALDTRIEASFPIAGSLPIAVHFATHAAFSDYEQFEPSLLSIATYADMYVMATAGSTGAAGRRQMQFLNYRDACCFAGDHRAAYEAVVANAAERLGGAFSVNVDMENTQHSLSANALALLLEDVA